MVSVVCQLIRSKLTSRTQFSTKKIMSVLLPATNGASVITDPEVSNGTQSATSSSADGESNLKGAEVRIPVPWGFIAGKAWGNKNGTPTLGLHGWMDNAGTFDKLAPLLSKSIYFVAVELPGHGFSSHLPAGIPYHFADYCITVRRIVKHFNWTKYSIIGHSMGAGIGALYSSLYPLDVENLVLLDLAKPITGDTSNYASKMASALNAFLVIDGKINPVPPTYTYADALERLVRATSDSLTEDAAKILLVRGSRQVDEDQYTFTRDLRLRSPSFNRFSHSDCYDLINEIRCKVIFIKAKDGPYFEPKSLTDEAVAIYKKKCAAFHYVEVEGNHFVHLNDPTEIADHVNRFFHEQKASL